MGCALKKELVLSPFQGREMMPTESLSCEADINLYLLSPEKHQSSGRIKFQTEPKPQLEVYFFSPFGNILSKASLTLKEQIFTDGERVIPLRESSELKFWNSSSWLEESYFVFGKVLYGHHGIILSDENGALRQWTLNSRLLECGRNPDRLTPTTCTFEGQEGFKAEILFSSVTCQSTL